MESVSVKEAGLWPTKRSQKKNEARNNAIDKIYQAGSSFYDAVYAAGRAFLPKAEADILDTASSITGKIVLAGGVVVGALDWLLR